MTLVLLLISVIVLAVAFFLRPRRLYQGPVSDHFDGKRFFIPGRLFPHGFGSIVRKLRSARPKRWSAQTPGPVAAEPSPMTADGLRVRFIGHATVLIQVVGLNVLTDPFWSERASPVSWGGPRRVLPPGIAFEDLPPIDAVIISHAHYDHLDAATIRRLVQTHDPVFVTPLGTDVLIRRMDPRARTTALDWSERTELRPDVAVSAEPAHHWSARGLSDRNASLWAAFVLSTPCGKVLFVGDSGYAEGRFFRPLGEIYGGFRLAILPIGAYEPRWFMAFSHMDPDEAVQAFEDVGANYALAHHFGTLQLSDESIDAPGAELLEALARRNLARDRFRALRPGSVWDVPPSSKAEPEKRLETESGPLSPL